MWWYLSCISYELDVHLPRTHDKSKTRRCTPWQSLLCHSCAKGIHYLHISCDDVSPGHACALSGTNDHSLTHSSYTSMKSSCRSAKVHGKNANEGAMHWYLTISLCDGATLGGPLHAMRKLCATYTQHMPANMCIWVFTLSKIPTQFWASSDTQWHKIGATWLHLSCHATGTNILSWQIKNSYHILPCMHVLDSSFMSSFLIDMLQCVSLRATLVVLVSGWHKPFDSFIVVFC